jgi:hypothetical protein
VKCESCHKKEIRPAHQRCLDCHTDQHGGQLTAREDRGECGSCHQVAGWTPSTFTAEDHDRLRFPLEGRHKVVDCARCHGPADPGRETRAALTQVEGDPGPAKVALRLGRPQCTACHADPHQGRLAAVNPDTGLPSCITCHNQLAFRPSTLTAQSHGDFGFALEGVHASTPCLRCHEGIGKRPPESVLEPFGMQAPLPASAPDQSQDEALVFRADTRCVSCHFSPHGGQFLTRRDGGTCGSCHDGNSFRPAVRFDHNRTTRFPLLRAHNNVACATCHLRAVGDSGIAAVNYRPVSLDCRECHLRAAVAVNGRAGRFPNPTDIQ